MITLASPVAVRNPGIIGVASRRGEEIYGRDIRAKVESGNKGKYVASDIESGAWEMHADEIITGDRLRARVPDAQIWMTRVGYGYIRRFGAGRGRRTASCKSTVSDGEQQ